MRDGALHETVPVAGSLERLGDRGTTIGEPHGIGMTVGVGGIVWRSLAVGAGCDDAVPATPGRNHDLAQAVQCRRAAA